MGHNNAERSITMKNRFYARVVIRPCLCVCLCRCRSAATYSIGLQSKHISSTVTVNITFYIVVFYVLCAFVIARIPAANSHHFIARSFM
jgi:hypothetical protein